MNEPRRIVRHHWLGEVLSPRGPGTPPARLVACALFNHMNREGSGATVSGRTLAIETGLAYSTVVIAQRQLIEQGWILRFEKGRGQYGKPIYVQEATLPEPAKFSGNGPAIGSMNGTCIGPTSGAISNGSMGGPTHPVNESIDENQWTDSPKSMDRPSVQNLSETFMKPVVHRLKVGADPRLKDRNPESEEQLGRRIRTAFRLYPRASDLEVATRLVPQATIEKVRRMRGT